MAHKGLKEKSALQLDGGLIAKILERGRILSV
jgi:hypothetical protein